MNVGVKRSSANRRDDIQGLRAVGAVLVAIYHIWVGRVSGGVDVFFLVSGYFLIGSAIRSVLSENKVNVFSFYTKIFRRIIPLSFFVILVTIVASSFFIPLTQQNSVHEQSLASLLYLENYYLAFKSVDYLARDSLSSPFQHYWAMSAQVQSIVVVTGLLFLACLFKELRHRKTFVSFILIAVSLVSLSYSIYATENYQRFAYYDTLARLWEFSLGGLLALHISRVNVSPSVRLFGGWIAFFAIVLCGAVINVSTLFPGYAALWPVGAAIAIIAVGDKFQHNRSVGKLLGTPLLVNIGSISYALYLVHWPLLVFFQAYHGNTAVSYVNGFLILGASFAAAYILTYYVEKPIGELLDRRSELKTVAGLVASALFILAVISLYHVSLTHQQSRAIQEASLAKRPGAAAIATENNLSPSRDLVPAPFIAKLDLADVYRDGCHQDLSAAALLSCVYGDPSAPRTLALVGGSHSAHWLSALQEVIARHPDWKIVTYTKSSCVFASDASIAASRDERSCQDWNANLVAELLKTRPDITFTTSTKIENGVEVVPERYLAQWQSITKQGLKVVAVRDTPWFKFDVPTCVERSSAELSRCVVDRSLVLAQASPTASIPQQEGVTFIDLNDYFCSPKTCFTVAGGVLMYYDQHHVTKTYMHTLAPKLEELMAKML